MTNAIISWLAAIIFYYDIQFILSKYVSTHWFEISIRLRGDTHLQRDKDNNSVTGIDKLFTAPQIKGNICMKEQVYYYSNCQISASSRSESHADAQMTWMIQSLSTKYKFKEKKNTVSFQDNKSQPVDYSILPSVAQLKLNRNCSLFSSY